MKNIYHCLFYLSVIIFIFGCSDSDSESDPFKVIKSDVIFDAAGGTGTIELFSSGNTITAKSEDDWCEVKISGNIITVLVNANDDISSRNTLILIESEGKVTSVPVTQSGIIFYIENAGNGINVSFNGDTKSLKVKSPFPIEISTNDGWIQHKIEGEDITITIPSTNAPRIDTVKVISNGRVIKYPVRQILNPPYQYYIGTYKFTYIDDFIQSNEMLVTLTEKEQGVSYIMDGPNFNYPFQVTYRTSDGLLEVRPQLLEKDVEFGPPFGDGSIYDVYLGLWGTDASYTAPTNSTAVSLKGSIDKVGNDFSVVFTDGGGWPQGKIDALNFAFFDDDNDYVFDYYGPKFAAMFFDIVMTKQ